MRGTSGDRCRSWQRSGVLPGHSILDLWSEAGRKVHSPGFSFVLFVVVSFACSLVWTIWEKLIEMSRRGIEWWSSLPRSQRTWDQWARSTSLIMFSFESSMFQGTVLSSSLMARSSRADQIWRTRPLQFVSWCYYMLSFFSDGWCGRGQAHSPWNDQECTSRRRTEGKN